MIRLHLLLAFVVAVAFATASSAAAQTQWTEYRIAGGDFRIEFPAPPKEEVRTLPSGSQNYSATLTPDADTYFSVQATTIASSMLSKPTETLLDIARNAQREAWMINRRAGASPTVRRSSLRKVPLVPLS